MIRYYIMAGTYEQAIGLAKKMQLHPNDWAYVNNRDRIRGIRNGVVLAYGTWKQREDLVELMEMYRVRDMTILYIDDWQS